MKLKKFLPSKGNLKQKEKTHRENICKWSVQQQINLQNIQAVHAVQYQKNKQPNQKNGQKI